MLSFLRNNTYGSLFKRCTMLYPKRRDVLTTLGVLSAAVQSESRRHICMKWLIR
jgi:hypothetical protein